MSDFLNGLVHDSWPWYIGGPAIGLVALFVLIIERKLLGVSVTFEQACELAIPKGKLRLNLLKNSWQIWFVIGMMLGGTILVITDLTTESLTISDATKMTLLSQGLTDFSGYVPAELYTFSVPQMVILGVGGLLIGFGTRYAGGCTAGHSIMGVSQLAPSSLIATIGFFVGGLISTYFIIPFIIAL